MALTYLDSAMIELPATITTLSARNLQATNLTTTNLTAANLQVGSITNSTNVIGDLTIYGQLTALSGFNVVIASTTSTSALSVSNIQARPALDVYQGPAHPIISIFKNNTGSIATIGSTGIMVSGSIGIGTASPLDPLDVSVPSLITGYNDFVTFRQTNSAADVYTRMLFGQFSTNKMFIETANQNNVKGDLLLHPYGGNVGIGTASPVSRLHVVGVTTSDHVATPNWGVLGLNLFYDPNQVRWEYVGDGHGYALGQISDNLTLWYAPNNTAGNNAPATISSRITVDTSGNVGIGTANPQNKLSVRDGDISLIAGENLLDAGRSIRFFANAQDDTTNNYAEIKGGAINAGISPQQGYLRFNTSGIERLRIDSAGSILTTSRILMSADGSNFRWIGAVGTGTDGSRIGVGLGTGNPSTGVITDIRLRTNDINRVAVLSSGNVGIGTEIPNERLTVVGSISATGTASMSALNIVSGNVFPKTTFNNLVSALAINVNGTILYMPLLSAI